MSYEDNKPILNSKIKSKSVEDKVRQLIRKNASILPKIPLNSLKIETASLRKHVIDDILRLSSNPMSPFIIGDYIGLLTSLSFLDMIINTDISKHTSRVQDYLKLLKNSVLEKLKEGSS